MAPLLYYYIWPTRCIDIKAFKEREEEGVGGGGAPPARVVNPKFENLSNIRYLR